MEFLTIDLIDAGIHGSEAEFDRVMATLNAQHAAVNSNPTCSRWGSLFRPITYTLFMINENDETHRRRSAALAEALHAHCGALLDQRQRPHRDTSRSDASLTVLTHNLEGFRALMLRCDATFEESEDPVFMIFMSCARANRLPFLQVLSQCRERLPPSFDPDVRWGRDKHKCALHYAVGERRASVGKPYLATDPDAEVVDVLINGLGANPEATDDLGRTPLDMVIAGALRVKRERFDSDADYIEWRGRVDETVLILRRAAHAAFLQRAERDTATMMSAHPRLGGGSLLRRLEPGVVRRIAELSHAGDTL